MTFLELVNDVLIRLREKEVTSVNDTSYSKLISKYINDVKRQVEDSYMWNALSDTLTATTSVGLFNYVLEDSGMRFKVLDVINDTNDLEVKYMDTKTMNKWFLNNNRTSGAPAYYNFNGVTGGNTQVDLYPIPDGAYDIRFNIIKPQPALSVNSDVLLVPWEPVVYGAYAKAIAERGEDGGMQSSEAQMTYRSALSDAIAIESGLYMEEGIWRAS